MFYYLKFQTNHPNKIHRVRVYEGLLGRLLSFFKVAFPALNGFGEKIWIKPKDLAFLAQHHIKKGTSIKKKEKELTDLFRQKILLYQDRDLLLIEEMIQDFLTAEEGFSSRHD